MANSKANKSKRRGSRSGPKPRPGPFYAEWNKFASDVRAALQISLNPPANRQMTPYDSPRAVLKRMVYEFVNKNARREAANNITQAIDYYQFSIEKMKKCSERRILRAPKIKYEENPYYVVLYGLLESESQKRRAPGEKKIKSSIGMLDIKKDQIWRFGQQLIYAHRHKVPDNFLIGFLDQSGSIKQVCLKAKDPSAREVWYLSESP